MHLGCISAVSRTLEMKIVLYFDVDLNSSRYFIRSFCEGMGELPY